MDNLVALRPVYIASLRRLNRQISLFLSLFLSVSQTMATARSSSTSILLISMSVSVDTSISVSSSCTSSSLAPTWPTLCTIETNFLSMHMRWNWRQSSVSQSWFFGVTPLKKKVIVKVEFWNDQSLFDLPNSFAFMASAGICRNCIGSTFKRSLLTTTMSP